MHPVNNAKMNDAESITPPNVSKNQLECMSTWSMNILHCLGGP